MCHELTHTTQGTCVKDKNGSVTCSMANFDPSLTPSLDLASVPAQLKSQLPSSLFELPGILLFVSIVTVISLCVSTPVILARFHHALTIQKGQMYIALLNKISLGSLAVALVFGLTGAIVRIPRMNAY